MLVIDDLRGYSANAILRDGTPVCIRAIRPDDKERLAGHFDRLSSDSGYHRFFGFRNAFTPRELSYFTQSARDWWAVLKFREAPENREASKLLGGAR
jgi:hypothetical protein